MKTKITALEKKLEEERSKNRLLKKKMAIQKESALSEKQALLKEIHHRVKNNLTFVESLLSLQVNKLVNEEAKNSLLKAYNRIHTMALVHHQLYRCEKLEEIDASHFIKELVSFLFESEKKVSREIQTVFDIDEIKLELDFAIPFGLIIYELVSNSIHHAFPQNKGEITISFKTIATSQHFLEIRDNGTGFDQDSEKSSLGLDLIKQLPLQIGGSVVSFDTLNSHSGTCVKISFF